MKPVRAPSTPHTSVHADRFDEIGQRAGPGTKKTSANIAEWRIRPWVINTHVKTSERQCAHAQRFEIGKAGYIRHDD